MQNRGRLNSRLEFFIALHLEKRCCSKTIRHLAPGQSPVFWRASTGFACSQHSASCSRASGVRSAQWLTPLIGAGVLCGCQSIQRTAHVTNGSIDAGCVDRHPGFTQGARLSAQSLRKELYDHRPTHATSSSPGPSTSSQVIGNSWALPSRAAVHTVAWLEKGRAVTDN